MSKRAEELLHNIIGELMGPHDSGIIPAVALIDAALRKERERCAEIIRSLPETYIDGNGYAFVDVDYMPHEMKSAAIAAILAEEED